MSVRVMAAIHGAAEAAGEADGAEVIPAEESARLAWAPGRS
jgi:hypothetical protein